MIARIALGLLFSALIALLAYLKKSLSISGVVAAIGVGTVLYAMGDAFWYVLLLLFFISSSIWSHYKRRLKKEVEQQFAKGGRRDYLQVLANGGGATAFALLYAWTSHPLWLWGFVGSLATVTADTWATELGVLSKSPPRSILTGKLVSRGTSGGVSLWGTLAAASGAALIGAAGYLLWPIAGEGLPGWVFISLATVSGVFGGAVDSILGATWQQQFRCVRCELTVERMAHCGQKTTVVRGVRWMTNDAVNALSALCGGIACIALAYLVS